MTDRDSVLNVQLTELVEFVYLIVTSDPYSGLDGQETWNGFSDLAWYDYAGLSRFFLGWQRKSRYSSGFYREFPCQWMRSSRFLAVEVHW